jgi:hypothetical protein
VDGEEGAMQKRKQERWRRMTDREATAMSAEEGAMGAEEGAIGAEEAAMHGEEAEMHGEEGARKEQRKQGVSDGEAAAMVQGALLREKQ